jgi:hypothetical protein
MSSPNLESGGIPQSGGGVYEFNGSGCSTATQQWTTLDSALHKGMFVLQVVQAGCILGITIVMSQGFSMFQEWYYQ